MREPAIDIAAQFDALVNPEHPKNAMWVTRGTPLPDLECHGLESADFAAGVLIAGPLDIVRLRADPCEEMLADILDYVVPKSALVGVQEASLLVAQARHPASGAVILEMSIDLHRVKTAVHRCHDYGEPVVMSMADCLARRARLIAAEEARSAPPQPQLPARCRR